MMSEFDMIDLGELQYFLGLKVYHGDHDNFISQNIYIYMLDVPKNFKFLKLLPLKIKG